MAAISVTSVGFPAAETLPQRELREIAAGNRMFAKSPREIQHALLREASVLPLRARTVLLKTGAPFTHAIFPTRGLLVGLHRSSSGASVVVDHIGTEGFFGGFSALGDPNPIWTEIDVVLGGEALLVPLNTVRDVLNRFPLFIQDFLAWSQHLLQIAFQNVTCSRFHTVPERSACWLLLLQDRLDGQIQVPITHGLLAQILGVHRPSITLGLQDLTAGGSIRPAGRGLVRIDNRAALEDLACECYPALASNNHLR